MRPVAKCAVHREQDATGPCPRCGNFVCSLCVGARTDGICPKCVALMGTVERAATPWERRSELGFGPALWQTWKEVMFSPDPFFRRLKPDAPVRDALFFAWSLNLLIVVPNFFLQAANFDQLRNTLMTVLQVTPAWMENISRWEWAAALTITPIVIYPLTFYLGAGLTHLGCVLWGANKNGFNATLRAMGYSQSAIVAVAIPVVGSILLIYLMVLTAIGVARTQETTVARAAAGTLTIPVVSTLCLTCGVFFVLFTLLGKLS